MSRARQVANFDPALLAADEVSLDKVNGGTLGTGTIGGSSVVNTSGAITTTGAFTSIGIDDNAVGAVAMTIDADENIGIGTATPDAPLHIETGTGTTYLLIRDSRSTTGDSAGIRFSTNVTSTFAKSMIAHVETGGGGTGDLVFSVDASTADDEVSLLLDERMRINSSGNVGINDTSPGVKLAVKSSSSQSSGLGQTAGAFQVGRIDVGGGRLIIGGNDDGHSFIQGSDGATAYPIAMQVSGGKVGIGTASPHTIFQVGDTEDTTANHLTIAARYGASSGGGPLLNFRSGHGSNSNTWDMARIMVTDDGSYNGRIEFQTSDTGLDDGNDVTTKMTINSNGNILNGAGGYIYNASDRRLKQNITDLTNCLTKINQLQGVSFNWIDGFEDDSNKTLYGMIAQDVQLVDSNLVSTSNKPSVTIGGETTDGDTSLEETVIENPLSIDEKFIIPMLVEAVKELLAKVTALENA
jgi:hypothetical protein